MPIYEYRCDACSHEIEAIQKFSDPVLTDCPSCGKPQLKKLVSAAGFQLKGTGWYATDFKGSSGKTNGKSDGKAADGKAADGKTDGKAESGDAKTDSKPSEPAAPACGAGACAACS